MNTAWVVWDSPGMTREIGTSPKNPEPFIPADSTKQPRVKLYSRQVANKQPESSANNPDSNKQKLDQTTNKVNGRVHMKIVGKSMKM